MENDFAVLHKHRVTEAVINYQSIIKTQPYFAIKCNPHPKIVEWLAAMNCNFDCASLNEVQLALTYVSPDRIIFANPHCSEDDVIQLAALKIDKFVVDCESQIRNILKECNPKIILRLCPES